MSASHASHLSSLEVTALLPWIKLEARAGRSLGNLVLTEVGISFGNKRHFLKTETKVIRKQENDGIAWAIQW